MTRKQFVADIELMTRHLAKRCEPDMLDDELNAFRGHVEAYVEAIRTDNAAARNRAAARAALAKVRSFS